LDIPILRRIFAKTKKTSIMGVYSSTLNGVFSDEKRCQDDATGYGGLGMASNQVEHWDIADRLTMQLKKIFKHPNARVGMELPSEFGKEKGYYIYDVGIQVDGNNLFVVELCHNDNFDESVKRIKGSFRKYKTVQECFIYNYETAQWFKVDKHGNLDYGNSFSTFLNVDLNTLI
jgi:hypothetical protein